MEKRKFLVHLTDAPSGCPSSFDGHDAIVREDGMLVIMGADDSVCAAFKSSEWLRVWIEAPEGSRDLQ